MPMGLLTPDDETLDPASAHMLARVRRLMAISLAFTALAIAAVLGVIGYRVFNSEGSRPVADVRVSLPPGAKVVTTATSGDRLVLTIEIAGQTELRLFDLHTLQPRGRIRLTPEP
jgi:hypothetical protein